MLCISAPPVQTNSAGTAQLRSVPRYKSGSVILFELNYLKSMMEEIELNLFTQVQKTINEN